MIDSQSSSQLLTQPIIVVAGPTSSDKSSLAIEMAKKFNGYIINADSRQVYKELSIGTAKPTPDKIIHQSSKKEYWMIDDIEHYLYGHISIEEDYHLGRYQQEVFELIERKTMENPKQIPFLVGGTGLYIDSIVFNFDLSSPTNYSDCVVRLEVLKNKLAGMRDKLP